MLCNGTLSLMKTPFLQIGGFHISKRIEGLQGPFPIIITNMLQALPYYHCFDKNPVAPICEYVHILT